MERYYAELFKLHDNKKKFTVVVWDRHNKTRRTLKFGDSNYEDYTIHKDPVRKERYRNRHKWDNIDDPMMPGFWSYWILWNKKTLEDSIDDTEERYDIVINYED